MTRRTYTNEHGEEVDLDTGSVVPPPDPTLVPSADGRTMVRLSPAQMQAREVAQLRDQRDAEWKAQQEARRRADAEFARREIDNPQLAHPLGMARLARVVQRLLAGEAQDAHDLAWLRNHVARHTPFDDWGAS